MSNFYDFLAPSEAQLARLRAIQTENQKIADQTGMKLTELNQMFTYGDPRGAILEDMGYVRPTLSMNLTQGREFLFGAQQKGFKKLNEGADFLDLTGEEKFGIVLSPLDILDVGGLTFGLKKLAQLGLKKLGPKSTLADAAKDGDIMKAMSDSEVQEIIQKLKPVIDGEQEFLLRQATGKQTTTPKTTGALTTKDEIFGLGDDLRAPKQVDEPVLKQEPSPVKPDELEAPVTIDDVLETTRKDLAGREAFEGMTPEDIIGKGEEPRDPFLTPDEPISAPKQETQTVAKDPVVVDLKNKIPEFTNLSDAEKQLVAQRFAQSMLNPAKRKELTKSLSASELAEVERYAVEKRLITKETVDVIKQSQKNQPGGDEISRLAKVEDQKLFDDFETELSTGNFNSNDPQQVRLAFANAFTGGARKTKFTGVDPLSKDKNYLRALSRKIIDYNKNKGFGPFNASKGFEKGRVYNRDQLQQINRFLKVGEDSLEKSSVSNKFENYLTGNNVYNDLKNTMQPLDDSFYPIVDGKIDRDFTKKLKRYLNFVRETSAKTKDPVKGSFDPFMKEFDLDIKALADPNSIEYKNFQKFAYYDKIREEVGNITKPILNKIFKAPKKRRDGSLRTEQERIDDARNSIQIAHTFEASQVGETVGEGLTGSGMIPGSYYLDLSNYNAIQQPKLEAKARNAYEEFNKTGSMEKLNEVSGQLEKLGAEIAVGEFVLGRHKTLSEKLLDLTGGPPGSREREIFKKQYGISDEEIVNLEKAIDFLIQSGFRADTFGGTLKFSTGGVVEQRPAGPGLPEDLDIFQDDLPEGSYETANLMLPFFKLLGKAPVNEVAPIPTPKEKLTNPTKKQTQSLETEKAKRAEEDIFDPTPSEQVELDPAMPVEVTPITQQPMTSVFYSDIERAMTNAPEQFANKQEVLDFLNKNRIKKSEVDDYRIASLLKLYDDTSPIAKTEIISQVRTAPISGMKVHATGSGSEIINPNGEKSTRYEGYFEPGSIPDTQRERVLYLDKNKLPGDSGDYPVAMFGGENLNRHEFGIPNEENTYIVGWTRLSDRYGFVPPKVEGPQTKINVSKLTKEKTKNERSLQGLYAEAKSKIERLANQRGMSQADINDILIDFGSDIPKLSVIAKYADQLDEISPGLVNQMDELVVKNRELQEQITKGSGVDPSGVVRVTFADEIQSDILQAAAGRKQQLAAALRKIQEDGVGAGTNIEGLNRTAQAAIDFFEKNKSVFRPLTKTEDEVNVVAQRINKLEAEVDEVVNNYIATREIDQPQIDRLAGLLNDNINNMLDEVLSVDSNTMAGLFPDLPFKNRDEWADALIKKDLYELAYRKFVLKDPDASAYYAVSPSKYVIERYRFKGDASTPQNLRDADKQRRFDAFKRNGQFLESEYKGIGMDEFYGGPNAVSNVIDNSGTAATNPNFGKPKHYTSTIETILKKQAQSNNSEIITMPVQLKGGRGSTQYRVTDQNGNMVATLTNEDQARELLVSNPNYRIQPITIPSKKDMEPVFAIKITPEMLEPYKTHKAQGGLVEHIDIFEV
jgi:hypothetical protein